MAKVCVIGLGYIGLPTACLLAASGHSVVGVDVDERKVKAIDEGKAELKERGFDELFKNARKNLVAKSTPEQADFFIIAVPTPLRKDKTPSYGSVVSASKSISKFVEKDSTVILESTVGVGATEEYVGKVIERESGLKYDKDFFIAHCPERAFPGNLIHELVYNDRIVGTNVPEAGERIKKLYSSFCKGKIHLTDLRTAEFVKLIENTYRAVNIAFANELAKNAETLNIDVFEAIKLANRHPRVNIHLPGAGVGGHCIPVDPYFLMDKGNFPLTKLAVEINESMPSHMVELLESAAAIANKKVSQLKVVVLGIAYKPDVDDIRDSPAFELINQLTGRVKEIVIHDPVVMESNTEIMRDLELAAKGRDALILVTDHSYYRGVNWAEIAKLMNDKPIFIDGRNITDSSVLEGFIYAGIGKGKCDA